MPCYKCKISREYECRFCGACQTEYCKPCGKAELVFNGLDKRTPFGKHRSIKECLSIVTEKREKLQKELDRQNEILTKLKEQLQ